MKCYFLAMAKLDQPDELLRMQRSPDQRIGVHTGCAGKIHNDYKHI